MNFRVVEGLFRVPVNLEPVPDHPTEPKERFYSSFIIPAMKFVLRRQKIMVTVVGAENFPTDGGALLAMNHTGYYDFIFGGVSGYLRGRRLVRFMAKKEVFDVPVVGTVMNQMDHVSVDRARGSGSIDEAVTRITSGQVVGIFPEATISRSFELKEFKTGAARIAALADAPLIPVVLWGSQRIWTKGLPKNLGRAGIPIRIHMGPPVDTEGTPEEVTARLKATMQILLDAARTAYDQEHGPFADGEPWRPASMGGSAPTLAQADEIESKERAERQAAKEGKAQKKDRKLGARLNRRADKALVNSRGLWERLKNLVKK